MPRYRELENMAKGEESRVLQKVAEGRGYMVRPGVRFHLYISTPPCGDARVFPDSQQGDTQWNNTGVLRTKIEKGEGTVLLPPGQEGVFRDGRLLTMSCSDKLARWGKWVQGLLMIVIMPLLIFLLMPVPLFLLILLLLLLLQVGCVRPPGCTSLLLPTASILAQYSCGLQEAR